MALHLNYPEISKDGFGNFLNLLKQAEANVDKEILHLLYLRVSQINGCAYCIDLHYKDALKVGLDARKINSLVAWQETVFFSDKERALLAWVDEVTLLENIENYSDSIAQLKEFFSDKEIVELTFAIATMNALNRVAIAFNQKPKL